MSWWLGEKNPKHEACWIWESMKGLHEVFAEFRVAHGLPEKPFDTPIPYKEAEEENFRERTKNGRLF